MRRHALIAMILSTAWMLGCGGAAPSQMVLGPYPSTPPPELWAQTLAALAEAQYEPEGLDPERGQIVVPSRIYGSREPILIQLYREGWVQVSLAVQRHTVWKRRIPRDLATEHVSLSLALREHLEREPSARGGAEPDR